ncbi:MAG: MoaD/ThiS family protein [Desulfobulbaceae bacterium]|nr:MoaD/ThiS family protein [Desulfobulbaceae bacterium]
MKITVKLFAFFRQDRFKEEERRYPDTTTVTDVIQGLGIAVDEVGVTMINSRHCALDSSLKAGDVLAIFPVIGGG